MPTEHHIEVRRTARYYTIGEPTEETRDVWFVCHGYGQLARLFVREFEDIASPSRLIVAPEALLRYYLSTEPGFHSASSKVGATWMTREDRESDIADYVDYLDTLYADIFSRIRRNDVSVTALGFSQGGTTTYRWLTRGRAHANRLVMWGSTLPPEADLAEAASFFRGTSLTIVYGNRDQFAEEETITKYVNSLREKDVPYELITFNGGHRLDRATLRALTGD